MSLHVGAILSVSLSVPKRSRVVGSFTSSHDTSDTWGDCETSECNDEVQELSDDDNVQQLCSESDTSLGHEGTSVSTLEYGDCTVEILDIGTVADLCSHVSSMSVCMVGVELIEAHGKHKSTPEVVCAGVINLDDCDCKISFLYCLVNASW